MKDIILIRHAESESNIGVVLEHQNTIKITPNGKKQAAELSEILSRPDKIICSKYIRTLETAEPLISKYPDSEVHIWTDTHEFQPVNSNKYAGLSSQEKDIFYKEYWKKMDPEFCDGGNAESFVDFVDRTNKAIIKMKKLDGINYIFSHGNFMRCVLVMLNSFNKWNSDNENIKDYHAVMRKFADSYLNAEINIKNTDVINITERLMAFNIR